MSYSIPRPESGTPPAQPQPPQTPNSMTQLFQSVLTRAFSWMLSPFGWSEAASVTEGGLDEETDAQVAGVMQSALGTPQPESRQPLSTEERQARFADLQRRLAEMQAAVGELQEETPQGERTPFGFDSIERENGGEPLGELQPKKLVFPTPEKEAPDDPAD